MTPTLPLEGSYVDPLNSEIPFSDNIPYSDGAPMDSDWQVLQIQLFRDILETNWQLRRFYCAGNMFLYFSPTQVRNREFLGPDFFVALDVEHDRLRKYWAIWEEGGRHPDFIVELLSPSTALEDRTTKKDVYEQKVHAHEYVCYDPETEQFEAWRLEKKYRPIEPEAGRIWCESLGLWLGLWHGTWMGQNTTWLRFFDKNGNMLPTEGEKEAALARAAEAENQRLRKELEALRQQSKP